MADEVLNAKKTGSQCMTRFIRITRSTSAGTATCTCRPHNTCVRRRSGSPSMISRERVLGVSICSAPDRDRVGFPEAIRRRSFSIAISAMPRRNRPSPRLPAHAARTLARPARSAIAAIRVANAMPIGVDMRGQRARHVPSQRSRLRMSEKELFFDTECVREKFQIGHAVCSEAVGAGGGLSRKLP